MFSPDRAFLAATLSAPQSIGGGTQTELLLARTDGSEPRVLSVDGLQRGGVLWLNTASMLLITATGCSEYEVCTHAYVTLLDVASARLTRLWEISGSQREVDWHT